MKGVLECYRILRGVVEVSLWCLMMSKYVSDEDASLLCLMMSKYVSDEDASCPWDVFRSQGVSLRCP